jgi:hypothetical protein
MFLGWDERLKIGGQFSGRLTLAGKGRGRDLYQVRRGEPLIRKKVTALEVHIDQIALIDRKGHAGFGPALVNHATRVFIRTAEEGAFEDQLAAFAAGDAFPSPVLDHLFNVLGPDGAKDKAADLAAQPREAGRRGAAH